MIKDAIAKVAKAPGFSTEDSGLCHSAPEQYNSVKSDPGKGLPIIAARRTGVLSGGISTQAPKRQPVKSPSASAFWAILRVTSRAQSDLDK